MARRDSWKPCSFEISLFSSYVQEGVNGWLFPAGDIQKLADTISIALKQSSKSAAYAEAAKEYVQMAYSETEMLSQWKNLLESRCDHLQVV